MREYWRKIIMTTKKIMNAIYDVLSKHVGEINLPNEHVDFYIGNSEIYLAIDNRGYNENN